MASFAILRDAHLRVTELLELLQSSKDKEARQKIFQQIKSEIQVHTEIEEEVFYPRFAKYDEFFDFLEASYDEHQEIKDIIEEIEQIESESQNSEDVGSFQLVALRDELQSAVQELSDVVNYHIHQEELRLFPVLETLLNHSEMNHLERSLQKALDDKNLASKPDQAA